MSDIVRMVVVLSLIAGVCSAALTAAHIQLGPQIEKQTDLYVRGPALERLFGKPAEEVLGNKVIISAGDQEIPVFFSRKDQKAGLCPCCQERAGLSKDEPPEVPQLLFGVPCQPQLWFAAGRILQYQHCPMQPVLKHLKSLTG